MAIGVHLDVIDAEGSTEIGCEQELGVQPAGSDGSGEGCRKHDGRCRCPGGRGRKDRDRGLKRAVAGVQGAGDREVPAATDAADEQANRGHRRIDAEVRALGRRSAGNLHTVRSRHAQKVSVIAIDDVGAAAP